MSIKKMLLLASMALAAIAFAAPAVAQADVTLTENGNPLGTGDEVTATSENLVTTAGENALECAEVQLHFEVVTNGNEHVVLQQLEKATTKGCFLNVPGVGSFPSTITDGAVGVGAGGQLTIDTSGTGETTATFVSHSYAGPHGPETQIAKCHFSGPVHVQATHNTDILHVDGDLTRAEGEETCPSEAANIHGTFTLETTNGTPVKIHFPTAG